MLSPLLFNILFATTLLVVLERCTEDADILASLAKFQEQPSKCRPETAPECTRSAWGMVCTDDVCIVSRSPRGLERMMMVLVKVFGEFGLPISDSKTETMYIPISRAPATQIVFHATEQQYGHHRLEGTVTETSNKLSAEIEQRVRAGWKSLRRYSWELHDCPKVSVLHLKVRMVESEVVETLLYGCDHAPL